MSQVGSAVERQMRKEERRTETELSLGKRRRRTQFRNQLNRGVEVRKKQGQVQRPRRSHYKDVTFTIKRGDDFRHTPGDVIGGNGTPTWL